MLKYDVNPTPSGRFTSKNIFYILIYVVKYVLSSTEQ